MAFQEIEPGIFLLMEATADYPFPGWYFSDETLFHGPFGSMEEVREIKANWDADLKKEEE